jgi:hypothetical protein
VGAGSSTRARTSLPRARARSRSTRRRMSPERPSLMISNANVPLDRSSVRASSQPDALNRSLWPKVNLMVTFVLDDANFCFKGVLVVCRDCC